MARAPALLCMLAVCVVQMPWLSCATDCKQSLTAVCIWKHDCHDCHESASSDADHPCCPCCRHEDDGDGHDGDGPAEGDHGVFCYELLVSGVACTLPPPVALLEPVPAPRASCQPIRLATGEEAAVPREPPDPMESVVLLV